MQQGAENMDEWAWRSWRLSWVTSSMRRLPISHQVGMDPESQQQPCEVAVQARPLSPCPSLHIRPQRVAYKALLAGRTLSGSALWQVAHLTANILCK